MGASAIRIGNRMGATEKTATRRRTVELQLDASGGAHTTDEQPMHRLKAVRPGMTRIGSGDERSGSIHSKRDTSRLQCLDVEA